MKVHVVQATKCALLVATTKTSFQLSFHPFPQMIIMSVIQRCASNARSSFSCTVQAQVLLSLITPPADVQIWDLIVVGAGVAGSALAYKQGKVRFATLT